MCASVRYTLLLQVYTIYITYHHFITVWEHITHQYLRWVWSWSYSDLSNFCNYICAFPLTDYQHLHFTPKGLSPGGFMLLVFPPRWLHVVVSCSHQSTAHEKKCHHKMRWFWVKHLFALKLAIRLPEFDQKHCTNSTKTLYTSLCIALISSDVMGNSAEF